MRNVILICGQAGSGKNQFADYLKEAIDFNNGKPIERTLIINNANNVKKLARERFHWNGKKDPDGRKLLLSLTESGYAKDPMYWEKETYTDAIIEKQSKPTLDTLIIPDWRFQQTYDYFHKIADKVVCIRVERFNNPNKPFNHESERNFRDFDTDYVVQNNNDLEHLNKIAKAICGQMSL